MVHLHKRSKRINLNKKGMVLSVKKIIIMLVLALLLVACSEDGTVSDNVNKQKTSENSNDNNADSKNKDSKNEDEDVEGNFAFKSSDVVITIDDEAEVILNKLGEPMKYFEAPSCAYQGLDKTYYYNGFEVTTYTDKGKDYIANILLVDDSVTTDEGIYIGSSKDDVVNAYGSEYVESTGQYSYSKGDSELQFIFENNLVISILYIKKI